MNNKILVLCPHPDDEIFTFPFIKQFSTEKFNVSALFFIENPTRKKEALKSCSLNNWEALFASDFGFLFSDGFIHKNYNELDKIIKKISIEFDIIFSPLIEGGHQDHDTIGFCTAVNSISNSKRKVFFYPTYTAIGKYGLFSVMSQNKFSRNIFLYKKNNLKELPVKSLFLCFLYINLSFYLGYFFCYRIC